MGDFKISNSSKNVEPLSITSTRQSKRCLLSSTSESLSRRTLKRITLTNQAMQGKGPFVDIAFLILKVAALDVVRRISKAKCPFVWRGLQALQLFCYPPFKWIQRWDPFRSFVGCVQTLSKPLLILSIATTFSDSSYKETSWSSDDSQEYTEPQSEQLQSTAEQRTSDEVLESSASEKWLLQLHEELHKQGVTIPERINEDELRRFYIAAGGEFSTFVSSVKKTIRWRQSYRLLSPQELEVWSHLVFWHGHDVRLRPCLIIRLGLACSNLTSNNKTGFAQAVVSQVEIGVLRMLSAENPQITVLMDCEHLSPFRFPMQIMRSIAVLLQDHYPNRLGCLYITRLPSVARVIIQTLTQVLKPITRQKVRIVGENHRKILAEYLETLPSFLGGECSCSKCSNKTNIQGSKKEKKNVQARFDDVTMEDDMSSPQSFDTDTSMQVSCDQVLRTAIISVLMLWIFIAFIVVWHDP